MLHRWGIAQVWAPNAVFDTLATWTRNSMKKESQALSENYSKTFIIPWVVEFQIASKDVQSTANALFEWGPPTASLSWWPLPSTAWLNPLIIFGLLSFSFIIIHSTAKWPNSPINVGPRAAKHLILFMGGSLFLVAMECSLLLDQSHWCIEEVVQILLQIESCPRLVWFCIKDIF